ncbi:MAG: class I SAM-dependent methyltransferase [Candidatus Hodarchaeota archaeon]
MRSIKFITPKELNRYIPKEYYFWSSISPYYVPLFGKFFWNRLKKIIKLILKLKANHRIKLDNILDIGCGIGFFSLNIGINNPGVRINGIDILEEWQNDYIKRIFKKFNQNFEIITHNIETKSGFPDDFFDLIVALDVMEHVRNLKPALDEIERVLKKNGKFIITIPVESIILQYARMIYARVSKRLVCNDHWKGAISSVQMFDKLIKKKFKVEYYRTYPFSGFPLTFSYGLLYFLSKT